jgi:hypothetical protein
VGLKLIFLIVSRAVTLLGLSRREAWWKDAEILMLRHQLAVAGRERPRARARLTWPDRALLALLAGTLPIDRLAAIRLIVTPGTILRWHRDIVRRRWSRRSRQGRPGRPAAHRKVRSVVLRLAAQNAQMWAASVLIGIEPAVAPNGSGVSPGADRRSRALLRPPNAQRLRTLLIMTAARAPARREPLSDGGVPGRGGIDPIPPRLEVDEEVCLRFA